MTLKKHEMIFSWLRHDWIASRLEDGFPTQIRGWVEDPLSVDEAGTHFGYVHQDKARLECASGSFLLFRGMYFAVPGALTVKQGEGILITRVGYKGLFHLGGPIEDTGRLRYIDGCTDSLLIPPVLRGDACLNLLHLPPHTRQTRHTHPSLRAGLIIRGQGFCVTSTDRIPLSPGQIFVIEPHEPHSFHTDDSELLVLAYHPDSDFGPTHERHPMINRTVIGGGDPA